jgi:hypothetical protein
MKSFLTFTLAAGVALTTTSIAQAGTANGKAALNVSKTPSTAQAPLGIGGLGVTFDRMTLLRELDRLNQELLPTEEFDEPADAPVRHKGSGAWSF